MNKTELINAIAENAGLNKADAKKALDATISAISEALKKGDKIALVGFGTFSVNERPARTNEFDHRGNDSEIAAGSEHGIGRIF